MKENRLLRRLKRGDTAALEQIIDLYSGYVAGVIRSVIGRSMTKEDIEETAADVFVALWQQAERVETGKLKGYLGAIARHKALNKLRERGETLELEEDVLLPEEELPEEVVSAKEQRELLEGALDEMGQPDGEIFLRHYYYCQRVTEISERMGMNPSTVKSRLARGRKKLKTKLEERGFVYYENQ